MIDHISQFRPFGFLKALYTSINTSQDGFFLCTKIFTFLYESIVLLDTFLNYVGMHSTVNACFFLLINDKIGINKRYLYKCYQDDRRFAFGYNCYSIYIPLFHK